MAIASKGCAHYRWSWRCTYKRQTIWLTLVSNWCISWLLPCRLITLQNVCMNQEPCELLLQAK